MTKMAVMPIYGKISFEIFYFRTRSLLILKLDMVHQGLNMYNVYMNDDSRFVLDLFAEMSD